MRSCAAVAIFIALSRYAPAVASCHASTLADFPLQGPVQSVLVYSAGSAPHERYEFDLRGRVLEEAREWNGVYQVFRYIYSPNSPDYEIQAFDASSLQSDKRPVDVHRHTVKFDSLGRCVEEQDFYGDGASNGRTTYEYFGRDMIREKSYDDFGKVIGIEDHQYDAGHHILLEKDKEFKPSSELKPGKTSYRYDSHGNWIKQVTSDSHKHVSITYRRIDYAADERRNGK